MPGCAASSATPPTSSARRSPPSAPTPSCSGAAPPSRRATSSASWSGSGPRPGGWSTSSPTSCCWPRLDEGRPMDLHPVDLTALCGEAVQTSTAVGPAWPVSFSAPRPIEVIGDATSLRQVVDNLLGNVRSHTPEGTTTRVSVEPDGPGAGDRRGRRRSRHGTRRGGPRLRALLPVRSEPVAPPRRCRPRTVHRLGHRGRPRGHGHRHPAHPDTAPRSPCGCRRRRRSHRRPAPLPGGTTQTVAALGAVAAEGQTPPAQPTPSGPEGQAPPDPA